MESEDSDLLVTLTASVTSKHPAVTRINGSLVMLAEFPVGTFKKFSTRQSNTKKTFVLITFLKLLTVCDIFGIGSVLIPCRFIEPPYHFTEHVDFNNLHFNVSDAKITMALGSSHQRFWIAV